MICTTMIGRLIVAVSLLTTYHLCDGFLSSPAQTVRPSMSLQASTTSSTTSSPQFDAEVGIIGAGPAGLVLAHALQSRNHTLAIYERRSSFRPVGAAVFMHPIALNALREISPALEERLRNVCTPIREISVSSIVDDELGFGTDRLDEAPGVFGSPFVSVRFWDMVKALKVGLEEELFGFGMDLQRFEQHKEEDGGGVTLHFNNGDDGDGTSTTTRRVKYLIDAGGIRSKTRHQLLGDSPIPRLRATYAVAPNTNLIPNANGDRLLAFVLGAGVSVTTASLGNGDVWWTQTRYNDDPTAPILPRNPQQYEELQRELQTRFEIWPPEIQELITATPATHIIESTIAELPVSLTWGQEDVTLLGDAAHAQLPSLGLGVSTAFTDVSELVKQMDRNSGGRLDRKAMRWYERVRIPQTAVLQLASRAAYFANVYLGNKE